MLSVMVAVFALLLVSQFFLFKNKPKPSSNPAESTTTQQQKVPESAPLAAANQAPTAAAPAATSPAKMASSETETVVENEVYRIVFTNRGAQAKSWILKKYKDDRGQPLDLVNHATESLGLPLSLFTYDESLRNKI